MFIAIDLKSFYASVECVMRGLNPLDTCLVVADASRTEKTICLAVSPALKAFGLPGRPRLFEVVEKVGKINLKRGNREKSTSGAQLAADSSLAVDYIAAPPRMKLYVDFSKRIYEIYLRYIAPEDIHVYSIDEVFIDATSYIKTYGISAHELALRMIREVLNETGITATAGIGTNLYLCKIAMDIMAKKMKPDADGVRIAELDEESYRRELWTHRPLRDFWRIGRGVAERLELAGMDTMGAVARRSLEDEDWFFREFGVNAELIIDHAWGYEPVTMHDIKTYTPETHSISSGQVLSEPYTNERAAVVVREMAEEVALELVEKRLLTDQIVLTVGYDVENSKIQTGYQGRMKKDFYGRKVPVHAHGTSNLPEPTSSSMCIGEAVSELFARITDPRLLIRRITIAINRLINEKDKKKERKSVQLDLFSDPAEQERQRKEREESLAAERRRQETILRLRKKFGKNVVLKGLNFADGATQMERNGRIGGHKA